MQGQLNNEGGGKLHEIKRNRDKAKTDKETISFEVTRACDCFPTVVFISYKNIILYITLY